MDTLYYYLPFLETIRDFFELGGPVLNVIGLLTLFMWMLIIERLVFMRTGYKRLVKNALGIWSARSDKSSWKAHQIRGRIISQVASTAEKHLGLIQTCVALCPLLGLLGTVTGMIEVFNVMAVTGGGDAKSMAGGVERSTIPTMAGMVAALSGLFANTYLNRVATREQEFLQDNLTSDH